MFYKSCYIHRISVNSKAFTVFQFFANYCIMDLRGGSTMFVRLLAHAGRDRMRLSEKPA